MHQIIHFFRVTGQSKTYFKLFKNSYFFFNLKLSQVQIFTFMFII